jgi:hypothetical protein
MVAAPAKFQMTSSDSLLRTAFRRGLIRPTSKSLALAAIASFERSTKRLLLRFGEERKSDAGRSSAGIRRSARFLSSTCLSERALR